MQGQEAELVVRLGLQGMSFVVKVAGEAGIHLLAMVKAIEKLPDTSPGKKSLARILKSGEELHIFSINEERLEDFEDAAKRYGIQYSVAKQGKDDTGIYEILVKGSDAPRINYIIDKLGLGTVKMDGSIKTGIDDRENTEVNTMSAAEKIMADMMSPNRKERMAMEAPDNPGHMPTEQHQSVGYYRDTDNRTSIRNSLQEAGVEAESINDIFETARGIRINNAGPDMQGWNGPEKEADDSIRSRFQKMVDDEMLKDGRLSNELTRNMFNSGYRVDFKGRVTEAGLTLNNKERNIITDMMRESEELGDNLDKIKEVLKHD